MTTANSVGDLALRYESTPAIRALIQLIPYVGGAGDALLAGRAEKIRSERARVFFDELASGQQTLTDDLISSDEFLHCFFATSHAALNSRREEKIRLFARLLKCAAQSKNRRGTDEFEEFLSIIDDLSFAEWRALNLLDGYGSIDRQPDENDLQWTRKFWAEFRRSVVTQLSIPENEFKPFMARIQRTGLYEVLTGYWDMLEEGQLTARFFRLKALLLDKRN